MSVKPNDMDVSDVTNNESRVLIPFKTFLSNSKLSITEKFQKTNWSKFWFEVAIVSFLIGLALFIRIILAYEFRQNWGYGTGDIIWNYNLPFNIGDAQFRGFSDFSYYYKSWITAWFENGWYPYEYSDPINVYDYYSYPPVFVYFLVLTWRPGMSNFWMAFPMVFTDAACAGLVYLILREANKTKTSRVVAIIGGFLMAVAPINLIYDGVYWLNPGPVTLFTLISFYFVIKRKWWQAFFWLSVATMTKQNALFFTYPIFMMMVGDKIRNKSIRETVIESIMLIFLFIGVGLVLSVPYIIIDPYLYGRHLLFPGRGLEFTLVPSTPAPNDCVSFAKSLEELGFGSIIVAIASMGNFNMFYMILSSAIISTGIFLRTYKDTMDNTEFFEWIAIYTILTHIFMPRGVYKFYTAYYVPMILIAIIGAFTHFASKKQYVAIGLATGGALFLWFNFWLLTIDRWAVPFFLFMVALTIGLIGFIRGDIRHVMERKRKEIKKLQITEALTI